MKRLGFTLVELLVVIAISAVLLAVLLPALRSATGTALDAKCKSNLHQVQTAWEAALISTHGYIPYTWNIVGDKSWYHALDRVVPGAPVLGGDNVESFNACPTVQRTYPRMFYPALRWGYAVNVAWDPATGALNQLQPWSAIRHPSNYPWFADPRVIPAPPAHIAVRTIPNLAYAADGWGVGFHHQALDVANVSFADGSVRSVARPEIMALPPGSPGGSWFDNR